MTTTHHHNPSLIHQIKEMIPNWFEWGDVRGLMELEECVTATRSSLLALLRNRQFLLPAEVNEHL